MDLGVCRGPEGKSSCAAKAEGLGTLTPTPSRGSCSPERGEKCLMKVGNQQETVQKGGSN